MISTVRPWILSFAIAAIAAIAAWQAVASDQRITDSEAEIAVQPIDSLTTPLISVRRTPEFLRTPTIRANLTRSLSELVGTFPSQSCLAVRIDGEEVFADNPELPLVPASSLKVITGYGAHAVLGADSRYETRLVSDGTIEGGVLEGDLYFVGAGDPLLASQGYAERYEPDHERTSIEALADALVATGVTEINGSIIGDESRYEQTRYHESWPDRFRTQNQTGPLSALVVNDNFSAFSSTNLEPSSSVATSDPATFAAGFLDDLLEARGVIVRGSASSGTAPAEANVLASVESDPRSVVVNQMLSISDNMAAELLVREISAAGADDGTLGTTAGGAERIEALLEEQNFATNEINLMDGSGLSADNRINCRLLTEVVEASETTGLWDGFAVAGQSGTLTDRMVDTALNGKIRAKTGRLNDVGSLTGVATGRDDTELVFAWIANTTELYPVEEMEQAQDAIADVLATYPVGPSLERLSPQP